MDPVLHHNDYEVIIIGGSYAGLSAALALGRSRRKVLVVDAGAPCNAQTPYSHNFLTHDGSTPRAISQLAREQILRYPTVSFHDGLVTGVARDSDGFTVTTARRQRFRGVKVLLATGVKDIFPDLPGLKECWGISVLHCPYCHGYEVRDTKIGVIVNGEMAGEFVRLLLNWSKDLIVLTNGPSTISRDGAEFFASSNVPVYEKPIRKIVHWEGKMEGLVFEDDEPLTLRAAFTRLPFQHHTSVASDLGCAMTESNHVSVDFMGRTTVPGVYAAGDCTTAFRSISSAVATGSLAGAAINRELLGI